MIYEELATFCLNAYPEPDLSPLGLAEALMSLDSVPMHGPVHHYIVPAALLTVAARQSPPDTARLKRHLYLAMERAEKVLPGFCGLWGCCGAAVGCGIFASVWLNANPKQELYWDVINTFTARCLDKVASVGGPRCCKRVTYLALSEAVGQAPSLLGVNLGPVPIPACSRSERNEECRKQACPFYPVPNPL